MVEAAGFLLAGGRSSRMGRDKALLEFEGETLAERGLRKLRLVCSEVAIAGGAEELAAFGRVIADRYPGSGPLGGIVSALEQSAWKWNLFLPVDLPFVPLEFFRILLEAEARTLVTVARVAGEVHPLCGLYAKDSWGALRGELVAGRRGVQAGIAVTRAVRYLDVDHEEWFTNVNTPQEFAAIAIGKRG